VSAPRSLNRRRFIGLVGGAVASSTLPARGESEKPRDQGIGGTGYAPGSGADEDRGIGGTGYIGAIQRFGSIIVNDVRIAYRKDARVVIDGRARAAQDLRIGQVVQVVAHSKGGVLSTERIEVVSELVGRIENLSDDEMTALGQTIILDGLERAPWLRKGARVAVSGLRRLDGAIVASAVAQRRSGLDQIVGAIDDDGAGPRIGALRLVALDKDLVGKRVVLTGRMTQRGFRVSHGQIAQSPFGERIAHLSLESFVARVGADIRLGSGFQILNSPAAPEIAGDGEARAIIDAVVDSAGQAHLERIRFIGGPGPGGGTGPASPSPAPPGPPPGPDSGIGAPGPGSPGGGPGSGGGAPGAAGGGPGGPGGR
jgi:hypothetical protein